MKKIIVKDRCRACRCERETMLVRSRSGGLVTRDCLVCGCSNSVQVKHLPRHLRCPVCSTANKEVFVKPGKNAQGNYALDCPCCPKSWEVAQMVPPWQDKFAYYGFSLDTDTHRARRFQ